MDALESQPVQEDQQSVIDNMQQPEEQQQQQQTDNEQHVINESIPTNDESVAAMEGNESTGEEDTNGLLEQAATNNVSKTPNTRGATFLFDSYFMNYNIQPSVQLLICPFNRSNLNILRAIFF